MTCANCKADAAADGPFCSLACASERYALVMELVDAIASDVRNLLRQMDAAAVSLNRVVKLL